VNQYIQSGRGGAGNLFRAPITTPASGIPSQTQASPPSTLTSLPYAYVHTHIRTHTRT
jgi:hypothetical protein